MELEIISNEEIGAAIETARPSKRYPSGSIWCKKHHQAIAQAQLDYNQKQHDESVARTKRGYQQIISDLKRKI